MADRNVFADSEKLLARLVHAVRNQEPVTFLFGSALTAPGSAPGEVGVPDANTLIDRVLDSFRDTDEIDALNR